MCYAGVIIEAIKIAEAGDGIVIRFYESFGGKASAAISINKQLALLKDVTVCDILERPLQGGDAIIKKDIANNKFQLKFSPFKVVSVAVKFGSI